MGQDSAAEFCSADSTAESDGTRDKAETGGRSTSLSSDESSLSVIAGTLSGFALPFTAYRHFQQRHDADQALTVDFFFESGLTLAAEVEAFEATCYAISQLLSALQYCSQQMKRE